MARVTEHVEKIKDNPKFCRIDAETSELRQNCNSGYVFTTQYGTAAYQSQFHHIVCITAMQDGNIKPADKLGFYHDCMAVTEWNINNSSNLIGLPTKHPYSRAQPASQVLGNLQDALPGMGLVDGAIGAWTGNIPELPCHLIEHPDYTDEVIKDLERNVWQPLAQEQENCKVDGKSIQGELESSSLAWRQFLVNRGTGAGTSWRNRFKPECEDTWYIPFSMNPGTPRKQIPPPDYDKLAGSVKDWAKSIFQAVV